MFYLRWIVINGLVMALFVFEAVIPPFLFNGAFTLLIIICSIYAVLYVAVMITILLLTEHTNVDAWSKLYPKRSNAYYGINLGYDILLLFILGGNGHYVFVGLYAFMTIAYWLFLKALRLEEGYAEDIYKECEE
jgi:hypothetical protein